MTQSTLLQVEQIAPMAAITGWETFFSDGCDYLRGAKGGFEKRKSVFTAEILYNMVAMAIEKFVMAALMKKGAMPANHTMADLVEALDLTYPGTVDSFREELLHLDGYQEICDLDTYTIAAPAMETIPGMLQLAERVMALTATEAGIPQREME